MLNLVMYYYQDIKLSILILLSSMVICTYHDFFLDDIQCCFAEVRNIHSRLFVFSLVIYLNSRTGASSPLALLHSVLHNCFLHLLAQPCF